MLRSSSTMFSQPDQNHDEVAALQQFYDDVADGEAVLLVVGGGTAALTYLYTHDIEPEYTHIVILGGRGYWQAAAHRLAQPHHILALPHSPSDEFVDPAEHDASKGILPHQPESAYVHSRDYQARVGQLEQETLAALKAYGKKVFLARNAQVDKIEKMAANDFRLRLTRSGVTVCANKVVVANGAGPARRLPADLKHALLASAHQKGHKDTAHVEERILDYTDILSPVAEKCRGKRVIIYGGGATAAWAMEVAALTAAPLAWVAKSGFDEAVNAGPRVFEIIQKSQSLQLHGLIEEIKYDECSVTGAPKLLVKVVTADVGKGSCVKEYEVDFLINCIGQEQYELGGLPDVFCQQIKTQLAPLLDNNYVTGSEDKLMLGWATVNHDLMIIGAAQGTYYNRDQQIKRPGSVSMCLPRSGQVPITVGGVVSSVCAITNYMPVRQCPKSGKVTLVSLNLHVMNATQLAAYFAANFLGATPDEINTAVVEYIAERKKTEFGLSPQRLKEFLREHFGQHAHAVSCQDLRKKL